MGKQENILVGLDIGTTKICGVVGEVTAGGGVDIIGIGTSPSYGLKKGIVVNIEQTVESIKKAVEEAELMAGVEINAVYTGIAGNHIRGFNSRGVIAVKDQEVKRTDVRRVVEAARAVHIPLDRQVLHVVPQAFVVDDQEGIRDPLGISGVRLEAEVHIVTAAATAAQNIIKCVNRAGLDVLGLILQPLASGQAILTPEEKELGVAVIDIGGGTTDLAVFCEGGLWHTAVLGVGGDHMTNDVAVGLRTPKHEAERLKIRYGSALAGLVREEETIEVPSVGGRSPRRLSRRMMAEIIQLRLEEIFDLAAREIRKAGLQDRIAAGIVLTGGTSLQEGMVELAEGFFDLPVRRGRPGPVGGLADVVSSPMHATGVGLLLYALREMEQDLGIQNGNGHFAAKALGRIKSLFGEIFY